jgi:hypothetical protein
MDQQQKPIGQMTYEELEAEARFFGYFNGRVLDMNSPPPRPKTSAEMLRREAVIRALYITDTRRR